MIGQAIHETPYLCSWKFDFSTAENISVRLIGRQAKSVDENRTPGIF